MSIVSALLRNFLPSYRLCEEHLTAQLVPGDLIFFLTGKIPKWFDGFVSAISSSHSSANIYHVAMVTHIEPQITLIHALEKGVITSNFDKLYDIIEVSFFTDIEVYHVNVAPEIRNKAVKIAQQYIDYAYNDIFSPDFVNSQGEKSFYCSQLIQHAYNEAAGEEIFPSHPMNFQGTDGEILPYWVKYYKDLGISEVPQGVDGTHPGGLYDSDLLVGFNNV